MEDDDPLTMDELIELLAEATDTTIEDMKSDPAPRDHVEIDAADLQLLVDMAQIASSRCHDYAPLMGGAARANAGRKARRRAKRILRDHD